MKLEINKEKILIISDTHLKKWDEKKYQFLKKLFEKFDVIILNGDFGDTDKVGLSNFINSQWNKLFETLKSKQTIYLNGNHDTKKKATHEVFKFCDINAEYVELKVAGQHYRIEHGHEMSKASKFLYELCNYNQFWMRILTFPYVPFWLLQHYLVVKNKRIKPRFVNKNLHSKEREYVLITGHSHMPEINLDVNYANAGFVEYGYASYLTINNGVLSLHEERY